MVVWYIMDIVWQSDVCLVMAITGRLAEVRWRGKQQFTPSCPKTILKLHCNTQRHGEVFRKQPVKMVPFPIHNKWCSSIICIYLYFCTMYIVHTSIQQNWGFALPLAMFNCLFCIPPSSFGMEFVLPLAGKSLDYPKLE